MVVRHRRHGYRPETCGREDEGLDRVTVARQGGVSWSSCYVLASLAGKQNIFFSIQPIEPCLYTALKHAQKPMAVRKTSVIKWLTKRLKQKQNKTKKKTHRKDRHKHPKNEKTQKWGEVDLF